MPTPLRPLTHTETPHHMPALQVRCWQIREHTKAPQAAGAIHSDFERGFICAEIMAFEDMKEHGTEAGECSVQYAACFESARGVQVRGLMEGWLGQGS